MKYTGQIKTGEYEFLNFEMEGDAHEAVAAYRELRNAYDGGPGLNHKDWCRFVDVYVSTGKPPEDGMSLWQDMGHEQRVVVNELKKAFKRLIK